MDLSEKNKDVFARWDRISRLDMNDGKPVPPNLIAWYSRWKKNSLFSLEDITEFLKEQDEPVVGCRGCETL